MDTAIFSMLFCAVCENFYLYSIFIEVAFLNMLNSFDVTTEMEWNEVTASVKKRPLNIIKTAC